MRHNFVNDIGDYAKYALLRALCASDDSNRLGVIWYLTEHAESNGDGRKRAHLVQDGWDMLDPALLAAMRTIEPGNNGPDALTLSLVEQSEILPADTAYFAEPMPASSVSPRRRVIERGAWFSRALLAVAGCGLVFLDPDNGLAVKSVPLSSSMADKYATAHEITALLQTGAAVVLYQHGSRTPWHQQRQQICSQITTAVGHSLTIRTMRFGAFGVRAFFCIATNSSQSATINRGLDVIRERVDGWSKATHLLVE